MLNNKKIRHTKSDATWDIKGKIMALSTAHLKAAYFKSFGVLSNIYFGSDSAIMLLYYQRYVIRNNASYYEFKNTITVLF